MTRRASFYKRLAWALILVLGGCRFAKWGASVTEDEDYMLRNYCVRPVSFIVSHYEVPNNHILLAVLVHEIDALSPKKILMTLSDQGPLQLPSMLASVGTLILLFLVAARLFNPEVAVLSVAVLGTSWWHLIYSHMIRGYSLSAFFNLLNVVLLERVLRKRRGWTAAAALLPVSVFAAHYVLPVNVFFTAALFPWIFCAMRSETAAKERFFAAMARRKEGKNKQKLEAMRREEAARRRRAYALPTILLMAGFVLTAVAYAPIAGQVLSASRSDMTWGKSFAATGERLGEWVQVLGLGRPYEAFWLVVALGGGAFLLRRRRWGPQAVLLGGYLLIPLLYSFAGRNVIFTRVFVGALPEWAMLFGLGAYGLLLSRRRGAARVTRGATAGAVAAILIVSAGQVAAFARWNRGVDLRRTILDILPRAAGKDDFSVTFAFKDKIKMLGVTAWEYYGFSSYLLPYEQTQRGHDDDYLARQAYFIAAASADEARDAAAGARLDRFLTANLKPVGQVGALTIYETAVDSAVVEAYRAASEGRGQPNAARAEALVGLGAEALRSGDFSQAVRLLSEAEGLAPEDKRDRFQLGMAYYLEGDPRAEGQFAWLVAHDPRNARARLYYGDVLADRGDFAGAAKAYMWYFGSNDVAEAWILQYRARAALDALNSGHGRVARDFSDPERCLAAARAYAAKGSLERAAAALGRIRGFRALDAEELQELGLVQMNLHHYAESAESLRRAVAQGAGPKAEVNLAWTLVARHDIAQAREIMESLAARAPGNRQIAGLLDTIERL